MESLREEFIGHMLKRCKQMGYHRAMFELETDMILEGLKRGFYNRTVTARELYINRPTLIMKLKKMGIK